jgi:hypothetical protein
MVLVEKPEPTVMKPIKEEAIDPEASVSHSLDDSPEIVKKNSNLAPRTGGGGGPCNHEVCQFDPEEFE